MRTTIRVDDELLAEAKGLAAQRHTSLNSIMEEALRLILARQQAAAERSRVELPTFGGSGTMPGVDTGDWDTVKRLLEEEDIERYSPDCSDAAS